MQQQQRHQATPTRNSPHPKARTLNTLAHTHLHTLTIHMYKSCVCECVLTVCVSWTVIWLVCRRRWLCLRGSSNAKWNCCLAQSLPPTPTSHAHIALHCLHPQLCESLKQLGCKGDTTVISKFKWQSFADFPSFSSSPCTRSEQYEINAHCDLNMCVCVCET